MNLNQLKLFYLSAKYGSLSLAAKELNITPPAVTRGIQRFEEYHEVSLFKRLGKELVLTRAGKTLYKTAKNIFEMEIWAEDCLMDFQKSKKPHVRIDSIESFGAYSLPPFISLFNQKYPDIGISMNIMEVDQIMNNTLALKNDIGICARPVENSKLVSKKIFEDILVFIVRPDHALAQKEVMKFSELKGHVLVGYERSSDIWTVIKEKIKIDTKQSTLLELSSNEALKSTVLLKEGIAVIPQEIARKEIDREELKVIQIIGGPFIRSYYIIRHRNKYISPHSRNLLKLIKEWAIEYSKKHPVSG